MLNETKLSLSYQIIKFILLATTPKQHRVIIYALFLLFKDFARVARAVASEHDDHALSRHRRELPEEELDEEDKPKARSKVLSTLTVFFSTIHVIQIFLFTIFLF